MCQALSIFIVRTTTCLPSLSILPDRAETLTLVAEPVSPAWTRALTMNATDRMPTAAIVRMRHSFDGCCPWIRCIRTQTTDLQSIGSFLQRMGQGMVNFTVAGGRHWLLSLQALKRMLTSS